MLWTVFYFEEPNLQLRVDTEKPKSDTTNTHFYTNVFLYHTPCLFKKTSASRAMDARTRITSILATKMEGYTYLWIWMFPVHYVPYIAITLHGC